MTRSRSLPSAAAACLCLLLLLLLLQVDGLAAFCERDSATSSSCRSSWWRLRVSLAAAVSPNFGNFADVSNHAKVATGASFACELPRSPSRPTSAHRLRPGDVDVVAALGDSLTAANGATATSLLGVLRENRGYAWSIGGEAALDQHVTLPNILRSRNRHLHGFSTGTGSVNSRYAGLNVAVPGGIAADMPQQALNLVKRLKEDPLVNFNNDWKIITILIGGNDVCDFCKDRTFFSPDNYVGYIREALDILHANVPKAFVNVLEVVDVTLVKELKDASAACALLQGSLVCRCPAFPADAAEEAEIRQLVEEYQRRVGLLVDSGRYDTREDFTVVNQPFLRLSRPPRINGKYDMSFFAPDCFHFSQKGHDAVAKALWNNMLEPVGRKSVQWDLSAPLKCPTDAHPYLMTSKNS